jgi:NADPH-dependent 2,4-dienoyl-CoA reductase/sulfur reductase-like enzyme/nitrite reductase/ring-hydroxylating ferredoxin subunit
MTRHVVASVDAFSNGAMKQVSVDDEELLVVRIDDDFYALDAHCSHYGGVLAEGVLEEEAGHVVCPLHHAVFDVTSGADVEPPARDCLQSYPTEIEDGDVVVELEAGEPAYEYGTAGADERRFVLLGAGAAAASAAETLRREGFEGDISMVTRESDAPYDRPNLSKDYLAGVAQPEWIPLREESFYDDHDIELLDERTVVSLDVDEESVRLDEGDHLEYDELLVATGAEPIEPDFPGLSFDNVRLLRSLADAEAIVERIGSATHATVVGSSFIGMESAFALRTRGLDVTVISIDERPFERSLGLQVGRSVQQLHASHDVDLALGRRVERIDGDDQAERVHLDDGSQLETDLVVVGIGVRPATDFVEGLERGPDGGIVVDEGMCAAEHVYAAGDLARFPDPRTFEPIRIEHWRLAQQHGRIAARNMIGGEAVYEEVPFFWTRHFDTTYKYVGYAERWDEVVIRGNLDDHDFVAYYTTDDEIRAAAGTRGDRLTRIHALMRHDELFSAEELRSGLDV